MCQLATPSNNPGAWIHHPIPHWRNVKQKIGDFKTHLYRIRPLSLKNVKTVLTVRRRFFSSDLNTFFFWNGRSL